MATPSARLGQAASHPRRLARRAVQTPSLVLDLIRGLETEKPPLKYGCAKTLRILSEEHPALLYPQFGLFVRLLDHQNTILQWEAAFVLSHLAGVDAEDKFAAIFDRYFSPIRGPVMITAAKIIRGGARVARAKPQWADRIATEVLKVARAHYKTPECRRVAAGHAILAFGEFFGLLHDAAPVIRFVRRQLRNPRPATRKKAQRFLKGLTCAATKTTLGATGLVVVAQPG